MIKTSIGVMAYNEEGIIGSMLASVLLQKTKTVEVTDIIVVSSGCTDGTANVVKEYVGKDARIRLISQAKREGKASAINIFLKESKGEVLVLAGADTKLSESAIEELAGPFIDPKVGMTGGHPVPINDKNTLVGFAVHLVWNLHHELALKHPKLGELTAFRNVLKEIPAGTAVDELSIEAEIKKKGLKLVYCPEAIVYNRGPLTVSDFLKQRRRIYCGHLWVKKTEKYSASSMSATRLLSLVFKNVKWTPKEMAFTMIAVSLEVLGRFLGMWDFYVLKKNPVVWERIESTKKL